MLDVALAAARAGADVLREAGLRQRRGEAKGLPGDWVTSFDRASEDAVLAVLARQAPGIPVLAEESGGARAATMWAVDPLDGTTNFTRGLPLVGVSVGLLRDGLPELGAIVAPWFPFELAGERRGGATLNGERLPRLRDVDPRAAVLGTGAPFRHQDRLGRYEPVLTGAQRGFEDVRRIGAATLDLGWTATGSLDGYFELGLGTWDLAAGAAVVLALGGVITDWEGGDEWILSGDLLAGPPAVHEALLRLAAGPSG